MAWGIFSASRKLMVGPLALLPLLAACESGTDADSAFVQVQVTDAPADNLQSAEIWVSRVYLQGGPGNSADTTDSTSRGRVDLFNNPNAPFKADLMVLRNGITANLTQPISVQPGSYKQLRIVIDSAKVTLKTGFTFESGATTQSIKLPSASSSGIKVDLASVLPAVEGDTTTVLADIDVNNNFNIQFVPGSTTRIRSILFTPVIKEKSRRQS
jgi:hypothetical protein